jgi:hypothetical protein
MWWASEMSRLRLDGFRFAAMIAARALNLMLALLQLPHLQERE